MSAIALFNSLVASPFNNGRRFKKEIEGVCQIFFSASPKQQTNQPEKTHRLHKLLLSFVFRHEKIKTFKKFFSFFPDFIAGNKAAFLLRTPSTEHLHRQLSLPFPSKPSAKTEKNAIQARFHNDDSLPAAAAVCSPNLWLWIFYLPKASICAKVSCLYEVKLNSKDKRLDKLSGKINPEEPKQAMREALPSSSRWNGSKLAAIAFIFTVRISNPC